MIRTSSPQPWRSRRRAEASVGLQRAVQGACRTTQEYRRRRRSEESRPQGCERQAAKACEEERRRCGGSQGGAGAARARTRQGAAQRKKRERRQEAIDRAQAALDTARRKHDGTLPTFKPSCSSRRTVPDRRSAMGKGTIQTRSVAPPGPRVGSPLQTRVKYRVVRALSVTSEVADLWRGRSRCTPQHWCRHCPTRRCPLRRPD